MALKPKSSTDLSKPPLIQSSVCISFHFLIHRNWFAFFLTASYRLFLGLPGIFSLQRLLFFYSLVMHSLHMSGPFNSIHELSDTVVQVRLDSSENLLYAIPTLALRRKILLDRRLRAVSQLSFTQCLSVGQTYPRVFEEIATFPFKTSGLQFRDG